jgi:hypothetical protein
MCLINLRVEAMIGEYFGSTTLFDLVFMNWIYWFNGTYKKKDCDGMYSFKAIAQSSFEYVQGSINELIHRSDVVSSA